MFRFKMWSSSFAYRAALLVVLLVPTVFALKAGDWKTCSQAGFCRRGRALSARAKEHQSWKSPYTVDAASIALASNQASFTAAVTSSIYPKIKFGLEVRIHKDGVVRVGMDEVDGLRKRYNEAASWALVEEPEISQDIQWTVGKNDVRAVYGPKKDIEVVVSFDPLKVVLLRNGKENVVLNGRGLLHLEHFRTKGVSEEIKPEDVPEEGLDVEDGVQQVIKVNPAAWFEGDSEDAWWEETFSSWTDSKPKGIFILHHFQQWLTIESRT